MRPLRLVAVLGVVLGVAGAAHAQGLDDLDDLINGAPGGAPAAPPPANPGAPQFPLLAGCESSPAGLRPGTRDAVVTQLTNRLAAWNAANFATAPAFTHPRQAEFALQCFQLRLDLLQFFIPIADDVLQEANAYLAEWGGNIEAYRTGAMPAGADPRTWWYDASAALADLVLLEGRIGDAVAMGQRSRARVLAGTREAMDAFRVAIDTVRANQSVFDDRDRAFWLKALAWRMVEVGREIDRVQLEDLELEPEDAYALIAAAEPDFEHRMVPEQIETLFGIMAGLRQARGELLPGAVRDWSAESDRRRLAEELYLLYATERNVEAWVDRGIADRYDRKRLELQLLHLAAVAAGMTEADSRRARDAAWRAFMEEQTVARAQALQRWEDFLVNERVRLVEAAIALPPPR